MLSDLPGSIYVSCDTQGFDPGHVTLDALSGIPEINGTLGIQPELWRVAEQATEAERHFRADGSPAAEELVSWSRLKSFIGLDRATNDPRTAAK